MKANEDYPYQSKGKLFQYEFITKLILLYSDKQIIINLKDALRNEQLSRQERVSFTMKFDLENKYLLIYQDEEMRELRNEINRLKSDFEQKWSSQFKMVRNKFLRSK